MTQQNSNKPQDKQKSSPNQASQDKNPSGRTAPQKVERDDMQNAGRSSDDQRTAVGKDPAER